MPSGFSEKENYNARGSPSILLLLPFPCVICRSSIHEFLPALLTLPLPHHLLPTYPFFFCLRSCFFSSSFTTSLILFAPKPIPSAFPNSLLVGLIALPLSAAELNPSSLCPSPHFFDIVALLSNFEGGSALVNGKVPPLLISICPPMPFPESSPL